MSGNFLNKIKQSGNFIAAWALLAAVSWSYAASYDVELPPRLSTDPDMCAYAPCKDVMSGADSFSQRKGTPPYVEAFKSSDGRKQVVGYVFLSTDIVNIPAYSGKPVVTLIGMDASGKIVGVKVLRHSEPILLVGIPETALVKFVAQYVGKRAWDKVEVGRGQDAGGYIGVDAISGATVTVIAENQTIMRSVYEIARQVGIIKASPRPQARLMQFSGPADWKTLLKEGAIGRLTVRPSKIGDPETGQPYIDMHFGYLNAPNVGRNILGDSGYEQLMVDLKPGEHAIFVAASGSGSFKGSAFVRGGIFDRIRIKQDFDSFTFRDTDYLNLYSIEAGGAPRFRESGIFILRDPAFSAAYPWSMVFLANRLDKASGAKTFVNFDREYWLPDRYLEGGRPRMVRAEPVWHKLWQGRSLEIAAFVLLLGAAVVFYAMRDRLARRSTRKDKRWVTMPKYLIWITTLGFAGFYLKAQPSITQVLTWFHALLFQWEWELFLSDPFIFIFWWFIIITTFMWGRGLFCGWLCPYGAMSELAFKLSGAIGLKRLQFSLPLAVHDKLKWIKYFIFAALLAVSLYSMGTAEKMAEVEPFKTTFLVGVWNRSWPYILFWASFFGLSMILERPFCKYLCPLGAGLAVPSTFRNFGLKRKSECLTCHACQKGCGSLAIDDAGRIDQRECLLCLDCQVLYYDTHSCPPLAKERKRRAAAGLPLTPITPAGYFASVGRTGESAAMRVQLQSSVAGVSGPRAGHTVTTEGATAANSLPGAADESRPLFGWLWEEAKFHLLPWSRGFPGKAGLLKAVGIGLAVVVTVSWLLIGTGHIGPAIVAAWWMGWSVYEVISRAIYLPWIKEGQWWKRNFRRAGITDIVAYVATKNLLIGATLFAVLQSAGALEVLRELPALRWLH